MTDLQLDESRELCRAYFDYSPEPGGGQFVQCVPLLLIFLQGFGQGNLDSLEDDPARIRGAGNRVHVQALERLVKAGVVTRISGIVQGPSIVAVSGAHPERKRLIVVFLVFMVMSFLNKLWYVGMA